MVRMEPGVQAVEYTLAQRRGSCRDSAWLLVQILRRLGIAARFASGYLIQLAADEKSLDGPSGPETDFCDLHAWAEAYLPGAGWIGLDATSGLLAGGGHIPIACTPEPGAAAPISGALEKCKVEFDVQMSVTRIAEDVRVTRPYTAEQWRAIDGAGQAVDAQLLRDDVRLTMGGEPTFVSIDDARSPQWTTEAVGEDKARLAARLAMRLRDRYAPEGALQFGQGKWYPGEPLPRWSYALVWREDGVPLWREAKLIAETPNTSVDGDDARRVIDGIAAQLGVELANVMPAFEDRRLRGTVGHENKDYDKPVGFILPVQPWQARDARGWHSTRWKLPTKRLLLIPGDSPVGLRLPLESLEPVSADQRHEVVAQVPFDRVDPLPSEEQLQITRAERGDKAQPTTDMSVRTALAVENRDGFVQVFLPPLPSAEDYVEMLAAVEATARALDQPVRLEGYEPPPDHRLKTVRVTPDPGVIEVNVAPSSSWKELVDSTTSLYEESRLCRLGTEKFMLDGRHSGTGGGNHVVLGGATPADSPFLRRPDLLRSFLGYFINHPSLSFLFSGMFVGPTSQAPRVDQARDDALYELEVAFAQLPERHAEDEIAARPWLIDRIFRDVLVDVTGNTHRTEICIDKLYSPDSATGRLGLVEFRSFEMPPHSQMSLAQALLIRALVSRFWNKPYRAALQHWGTSLHDRFMLPHFVWDDFCDVLAELSAGGVTLEPEWFAPHFEFRFPKIGSLCHRGIELELRTALEPWHVTGEHGVTGGTARYVDSSLERVQVLVHGLPEARYQVACNGTRVPLRPTGVAGQFVAGIRYRAWQPPQCLHPTIGVDTPLVLDLYDTWSGRSVAGCSYHVAHPAGRNYEVSPVNALEAEGRRLARFSTDQHSGGPMQLRELPPNRIMPWTLDMRLTHGGVA